MLFLIISSAWKIWKSQVGAAGSWHITNWNPNTVISECVSEREILQVTKSSLDADKMHAMDTERRRESYWGHFKECKGATIASSSNFVRAKYPGLLVSWSRLAQRVSNLNRPVGFFFNNFSAMSSVEPCFWCHMGSHLVFQCKLKP